MHLLYLLVCVIVIKGKKQKESINKTQTERNPAMHKVLCVCIGNNDRSPVMAAILGLLVKGTQFKDISIESAGIGEGAGSGTPIGEFGVKAMARLGIDISNHVKRRTTNLDLTQYDLIVCATDEIATELIKQGADMKKMYNAMIPNPWPCQFQEDYDMITMPAILASMYRLIARYSN